MELGALTGLAQPEEPVDYAFGAPVVAPSFGAASDLFQTTIALGTQRFSRDDVNLIMLSSARVRQLQATALADRLEHETEHLSVVRRATRNPVFARLAQLGPTGTVMALRRLSGANRPLWLLFLQRTSGARPAHGTDSVDDAARAWREWGKKQGLV
jgi:hypothetical protein